MARRLAFLAALAVAGCGSATDPRRDDDRVTQIFAHGFAAPIVNASGKTIGRAVGRPDRLGLIVTYEVSGLRPGRHAVHVHSIGRCDPPTFASSGTHWSQPGFEHGVDNPRGPHDGDWDNLDVGADGRGGTDRLIPRFHSQIPETGLALVIHSGTDDGLSQPEGNSGHRIACAVMIPPV